MASVAQIQAQVRAYYKSTHPNSNDDTKFKDDMGLNPRQVLDQGTFLAIQLGCNPTRTQILKCKAIKDLIALLSATRINMKGVLAIVPQHFAATGHDFKGIVPLG